MRGLVIKNGIALALIFGLFIGNAFTTAKVKEVIGTWNYEAPEAPYEYSVGQLIFTLNGSAIEGVIKIGDYEIDMKNIKVEGGEVSFGAYIDGEYVSTKTTIKKGVMTGKTSTSEGTIKVTAEKEK